MNNRTQDYIVISNQSIGSMLHDDQEQNNTTTSINHC